MDRVKLSRRRLLAGLAGLEVVGAGCGGVQPLPTYSWENEPSTRRTPLPGGTRVPDPTASRTLGLTSSPSSVATANVGGGAKNARWRLGTVRGTISGFADKVSAVDGEKVGLYVTTTAQLFDVEVYRIGWYAGGAQEADLVNKVSGLPGKLQSAAKVDRITGLVSCAHWQRSGELVVDGWRTGLYLLKLIAANGDQNYVPLVVRDDHRSSDFLFVHAAATDQAYNSWGGKSLYSFNSSDEPTVSGGRRAVKVTFDRAYESNGAGANQTILNWELNMVRFLEANGFEVTYVSDLDVHENPDFDSRVRAVLMAGHSEYWSKDMRDHLEAARDRGKGLGFFTGDTGGFAVRYEDSPLGKNRVIACYKDSPDPEAEGNPARATTLWSSPPIKRSSHSFIGIGTNGPVKRSADWIVEGVASAPSLFANTGFKDGDIVSNLVGYEYDGLWTPGALAEPLPGLQVLGRARTQPLVAVTARSGSAVRYQFLADQRPRVGGLATKIDPGRDWATGSLTIGFVSSAGQTALRYTPGQGDLLKYTAERGYAEIRLGDDFTQAGWRALGRDLVADYGAAIGPLPADARVDSLLFRGSGSLGSLTLTAPDGETTNVALGAASPEAAGWRIVEGQGKMTAAATGPSGERVLMTRAAPDEKRDDEAHTVLVKTKAGGLIFAAGTIQWSWALDAFGPRQDLEKRPTPVDPRLQALTRNVLRALRGAP